MNDINKFPEGFQSQSHINKELDRLASGTIRGTPEDPISENYDQAKGWVMLGFLYGLNLKHHLEGFKVSIVDRKMNIELTLKTLRAPLEKGYFLKELNRRAPELGFEVTNVGNKITLSGSSDGLEKNAYEVFIRKFKDIKGFEQDIDRAKFVDPNEKK